MHKNKTSGTEFQIDFRLDTPKIVKKISILMKRTRHFTAVIKTKAANKIEKIRLSCWGERRKTASTHKRNAYDEEREISSPEIAEANQFPRIVKTGTVVTCS